VEANTSTNNLVLPDLLRQAAKRFSKHRAIVFGGRTLDYATFDALSDRFAAGLAAQGILKGDRVGLYCVNSDAFAIVYFGIVKAGAVVVPVNLLLNPKEIAFILSDAGAEALVYHEAFIPCVQAIQSQVSSFKFQVSIGSKKARPDHLSWSDCITHQPFPIPHLTPEDLAAIIYTSGTTGRPKGAMLTHRNLASNTASVMSALQLKPGEDILLVVLPMFHAFAATASMLAPLLNGCTIVPMPKFEPETAAKIIEAEKVTHFMGVPSMYMVLLHLPDEYVPKFRSLKYAISGGAAMPVELMKRFEARFGKLIYEGDGPTECSPVTSVNPIGGLRKPASIGQCVPDVDMEIRDEQGRELPHGQIGEICVRGPNVMKGYWNLPKETAEAFFGEWFRTGDLGTEDDDGYFCIVDRKKDMIIVNGMNVYPRVVEELLYKHPAVREAAVIGEPDELHGEIPVACIALRDGAKLTSAEVRAFCRDSLGRHEVPKKVFFMPELPKNAAGKIMKRELRKHGEIERGIDSRKEET
jgi:long-chain acyl-CoA synthetase